MMDIVVSRHRYIVPFKFSAELLPFDTMIEQMAQTKRWKLLDMNKASVEQDIYGVILDNFSMQPDSQNIGCHFRFQQEEAKPLLSFYYHRGMKEYLGHITKMGMFLFRTGVGLLWYEFGFAEPVSESTLVAFHNAFKELSYEKYLHFARTREGIRRYCTFERVLPGGEEGKEREGLLMGRWLREEVFSTCPFAVSFFAERRDTGRNPVRYHVKNGPFEETEVSAKDTADVGKKLPDKALLFHYVVYAKDMTEEERNQALPAAIFRLTNGYNKNYDAPEEVAREFLHPFQHSYYYATMSGVGCYEIATEKREYFLREIKHKKIMFDHFLIYILTLYQNYSILKLTQDIEDKLPAEARLYNEETGSTLERLNEASTAVNLFLVKGIYASVSHIHHQNELYRYISRELHIKEDVESLTVGLESLEKLQELRKSKEENELEQEKNRQREQLSAKLNLALGVISVLTIISVFADIEATADILYRGIFAFPTPLSKGEAIVFMIAVLSTLAVLLFIIISSKGILPNRKKVKKK